MEKLDDLTRALRRFCNKVHVIDAHALGTNDEDE